jgi:heme exporter protein B
MNLLSETISLIRKDALLELRQRYAIGGILLYVISTIFIVYYTVGRRIGQVSMLQIGDQRIVNMQKVTTDIAASGSIWAAFFWVIVLFASVNAVAKSFVQENSSRRLYYYTLASPTAIILSKIVYNTLLLIILNILSFGVFSIVVGNPIAKIGLFYATLLLGSLGLSIAFTFISAIAAKARNASTLMAILSFPVIIPILMTLVRLSRFALGILQGDNYWNDIAILLSLDAILLSIVFFLFPFLWRD